MNATAVLAMVTYPGHWMLVLMGRGGGGRGGGRLGDGLGSLGDGLGKGELILEPR